jgi:hypothetical protein
VFGGGHVAVEQQEVALTNLQEVLGDEQGRAACLLAAHHVQVCGNVLMADSTHRIHVGGRRVLTLSRMGEGESVLLGQGGQMQYPLNGSRWATCEGCPRARAGGCCGNAQQ